MSTTQIADFSELSGYEASKQLLAQRYNLAGKSVFVVALPLHLIAAHLPIPDPERPFEGNRRVSAAHARKFGEFWRVNDKCVTPPLLFDTTWPLSGDFEVEAKAGGVEFGKIRLPHNSKQVLEILDGQHRILGWYLIGERINREFRETADALATARSVGEMDNVAVWEAKLGALKQELGRMEKEYVTLQIVEGLTLAEHKQVFADIANNAKGITKSVTTAFDQRSILNQITMDAIEGVPLLQERTDVEADRVAGMNENLLSAKNVADIVKHTLVGIDGRMTSQREKTWKHSVAEEVVESFFETLTKCFPDLDRVRNDELSPPELREHSLLGSATILRCLAGAFHAIAVEELRDETPRVTSIGRKKAEALFRDMAPNMALPISEGWWETGFFPERGSKAPSSRAQDLKGLTDTIASWAEVGLFGQSRK